MTLRENLKTALARRTRGHLFKWLSTATLGLWLAFYDATTHTDWFLLFVLYWVLDSTLETRAARCDAIAIAIRAEEGLTDA